MISGKTIADLLFELYARPHDAEFFDHVLLVLQDHMPFTLAGYSILDLETGAVEKKVWRDRSGKAVASLETLRHEYRNHPFVEYYGSNAMGPVLCTEDIMSESEWKKTALYKKFWKPTGAVHETSIRFYADNRCFSFEFSDPGPLPNPVRRTLNLIAPHLANAYRVFQTQKNGFIAGLPENTVLMSFSGEVIECPDLAGDLLERYYPAAECDSGRLPEPIDLWVRQIITDLAEQNRCTQIPKIMVLKAGKILRLGLLSHAAGYLLLLEEITFNRPIEILHEMGLSSREAEVFMWVVHGKQNSEIAEILDISSATVRKHVEHVLQKLNSETRGAAARQAMQAFREKIPPCTPDSCYVCVKTDCLDCPRNSSVASF